MMLSELQNLGLSKNESIVYSTLLGLGQTTAGLLIKKTDLHRNIVYDNLEKLIDKGLVSYVVMKGLKYFSTTPPNELEEYVDRQRKEVEIKANLLKKILPDIKQKRKDILQLSEATIHKGKRGLKFIFDSLCNRNELLIFASGWGMEKFMGSYFYQWHVKLKEAKTKTRGLLAENLRAKQKYKYNNKYLPQEFLLPTTMMVQANRVINIIWEDEPIVIVIESKKAAKSYTAYFELLWKIGK